MPALGEKEVEELFDKYAVLTPRELLSRFHIYQEQYCLTAEVEAKLTISMSKTLIFPAAMRYLNDLAGTYANLRTFDTQFDAEPLEQVAALVKSLQGSVTKLEEALHEAEEMSLEKKVRHLCDAVLPAMLTVRQCSDELEGIVADDLWPLPKYQEMLFIK